MVVAETAAPPTASISPEHDNFPGIFFMNGCVTDGVKSFYRFFHSYPFRQPEIEKTAYSGTKARKITVSRIPSFV